MSIRRAKEDIKREIEKLVQEYADVVHIERRSEEPVYLSGWVLFAEYETPELLQEECTATINIYPDTQSRAMSRGLYALGADAYRG